MARKDRSGEEPSVPKNAGGDSSLPRRDFLKITGLGGSVLGLGLGPAGCEFLPFVPEFSATLTRREDLVSLRFEFANLALENAPEGGQQLVTKGSAPGYISIHRRGGRGTGEERRGRGPHGGG